MAAITETFPTAPRGKRVIYPMLVGGAAFLFSVALTVGTTWSKVSSHTGLKHADAISASSSYGVLHPGNGWGGAGPDLWKLAALFLGPVLAILIGTLSFFRERALTAQFRIEDNVLVMGKKREPLAGLVEVVRDPAAMKGACKRWGNGGAGAIRGSFRSKRLGKFYAFLTDTEHAVVLRWADKVVAVSPADPEFFIYSARKAAGLT